jgi:hypothetical protein
MKTLITSLLIYLLIQSNTITGQRNTGIEKYGNTLNVGLGIGYYGYIGHSLPVLHLNYEMDVINNLTLAPFVTGYSYERYQFWGSPNNPYRNYYFRQNVMVLGLKGTYYFDNLLRAGSKWDFYLGGSLGFALRSTSWESAYNGERTVSQGINPVNLHGHIGVEHHFTNKIGLALDVSSGISSFCLAIHF